MTLGIGRLGLVLLVGFTLLSVCQPLAAQGKGAKARMKAKALNEAGAIAGAIWNFSLEPVKPGNPQDDTIRGRYRVEDLVVYQAETPGGEMKKAIGKSTPNLKEKMTVIELKDLRGLKGPKQVADPISGKAILHLKEFGDVEGTFIDSEGWKWNMKSKRIRE